MIQPIDNQQNSKKIRDPFKLRVLWALTILFVVIAIGWLAYWLFYLQFHESTDDAYANGNLVNINSSVAGSAVAFFADNTDLVMEGQLLVLLDDTHYQIEYEKELATLSSVVLQVRQLYDNVLVNRAFVDNKKVAVEKANYDYQNRLQLIDSQAISEEDFTHSKDALTISQLELKQAEEQLKVSQDAVGNTPMDNHPLLEQQKANVRRAFYNLQHCSIYAPTTGYVAQRSVEVGQWVKPETNLMAVIPADTVWVDANFKETQLTYMRIGQPTTVWFDLYGSKVKFEGKVLGIASGTGSIFSIIPPQNATGNWIKIVQRLPVRISLDPEQVKAHPIRLGISAEVNVHISDQDLPMLAPTPSIKAIASTSVYDIHLSKVNQLIDEVILQFK